MVVGEVSYLVDECDDNWRFFFHFLLWFVGMIPDWLVHRRGCTSPRGEGGGKTRKPYAPKGQKYIAQGSALG